MTVSSRALGLLAGALRAHRNQRATRWRKLSAGRQALLVVAYLREGETYADLACGFKIGTSTVYRYVREAITPLAAMAPSLQQAIEVARGKAFVIGDGTLLRIDRVGMASGRDRAYYSGKHKAHRLNVQVIADPIGRLVWISPPLPGAPVTTWAPPVSTASSTPSPTPRSPRSPTPPTREPARRWPCRSGGGASIPIPAATAACRATSATSTPRTPVSAAPASESTPS
jgi:hypothetical protein